MHDVQLLVVLATWCISLPAVFWVTDSQVYLEGDDVSLNCTSGSTSDRISFTWVDEAPGGPVIIVSIDDEGEFERSNNSKYQNFVVNDSGFPGSTQLIIGSIQLEDEFGPYRCIATAASAEDQSYDIQLEVPGNVTISDGSGVLTSLTVGEGSVYNLTCTATGAKSPNDLDLTWTPGDGAGPTTNTTSEEYNVVNYTRSIAYNASRNDSSLSCNLTGYVNDVDDELVSAVVNLTVGFVPECTITVNTIDDDCRNIQLECTCNAVPDKSNCSFYRNGSLFASECSVNTTVNLTTATEYSCQATNNVGLGQKSNPVSHECFPGPSSAATPIISESSKTISATATTTPSTTRPPDTTETCACTGHIAGIVVESVIIAMLLGVVGWFIFNITRDLTKDERGNQDEGHTGNDNPAYMDLHERNTSTDGGSQLLEVPAKNVKMVSKLPGSGLMVYSEAILTTSSGNRDAVVKSASEEATIKLEIFWSAEIEALQSLPKDVNLVQTLGWSNSVPKRLLFEYINGTNLVTHLTENFSMHEVHQYGNTKRKRFEVPETGKVQNLPRYALDVARGLKFLLAKGFIHPGIRACKVFVDLSGKCKIYDFVSVDRAEEMSSLLWKEFAPYQWMPLEYLILDTVAPPGDVWSFGVLMWEIYSYGAQPYPGRDRSEVESSLRKKERLAMPKNCPGAIWQLMNRCWDQSVDTRPKIQEIASNLATMCNDDKEYDVIPKGGFGNDQV